LPQDVLILVATQKTVKLLADIGKTENDGWAYDLINKILTGRQL
jgi:hypothetical protein